MKKWWTSLTHQFNVAMISLLGSFAVYMPDIAQQFPTLQPYLPHRYFVLGMIAIPVINMVIRQWKTSQPLTPIVGKPSEPAAN